MRDPYLWSVTVPRAMSLYASAIFLVLWLGFVIALAADRTWLETVWVEVQELPLIPRLIVWVLFLPIMVGLWIWHSSWPTLPRVVGLVAIVAWTMLAVSSVFRTFGRSAPTRGVSNE